MQRTVDSVQAQDQLINPFYEPEPADETGLNTHFRSTFAPASSASSTNASTTAAQPNTTQPHSHDPSGEHSARPRGASLTQRYPGDMTHRPLDMLKQDGKAARRSPHLRKGWVPGVDVVDSLDSVPGGQYHHEGPFDATLMARNTTAKYSPVAAVAGSNREALKATPPEKIRDAVNSHRPLEGVAAVPPGEEDGEGRRYDYEETNLMTEEGGDYKKMPGETLNDDQKRELEHKHARETTLSHGASGQATGIELQDQGSSKKGLGYEENEIGEHDEHDEHHSKFDGLKKRMGSLRRKKD